MSFFSSTIILPLFVSHFTDSPLVIGLIPFLGWAGVLLPQVFMANVVERAPLKKFFPVTLGFFPGTTAHFLAGPGNLAAGRQPAGFGPDRFLRALHLAQPGRRHHRCGLAGYDCQGHPGGKAWSFLWDH